MLTELPGYSAREGLWPSVVETVEMTPELISATWTHLIDASEDRG